ncbi:MAG: hypothetical protein II880_05660 [Schwartzia sp.]|nr:hypothetical protein [Schwartzia sp. (in: firmicutes)]
MTAKHDGRWDNENLPATTKQEKLSVQDAPEAEEEEESSSDERRWRWALLALVFFVALGGGFLGAGYLHDKSQEAKNDKIQQELIFAKQEESLRKQEAAIRDQREALEREKKALEARQRELEAQADRAAGRNEQIDEAERKKSSVRKVWEEVTGKDQERKKQQEENESIQTRSKRDVEEINRSIDEAAETLKMLNTKLAELEEMRQKAEDMKDKAMKTYEEHEETVQKILRFFESAMDMFGSLSSKG